MKNGETSPAPLGSRHPTTHSLLIVFSLDDAAACELTSAIASCISLEPQFLLSSDLREYICSLDTASQSPSTLTVASFGFSLSSSRLADGLVRGPENL